MQINVSSQLLGDVKTNYSTIQQNVELLRKCGFALHWLHPKSKRPIGNDWSEKPVLSFDRLKATYRDGNNLGVRLGEWSVIAGAYLHIVDVDIRTADLKTEAFAKLAEVFPELDINTVPSVISGSGGESRHYYLLSDKAFPSRKFAHSVGFQMVWDEQRQRDVKKWDWELHLLGTGAQAAIPPSIHPDSGLPYRWDRQFDFDDVDLGLVDVIPFTAVERVTGYEEAAEVDPERLKPMGLDVETIHEVLADLPVEDWFEDRSGWLNVGMALHHEMGGTTEAFNMWCEYAAKSSKFDLEDSKRVWRSIKNKGNRPFRMASLVAVAKDERLQREFEDVVDLEDEFEDEAVSVNDMFEDLLGDAPTAPAATKESRSQSRLRKEQLEIALGRGAPEWVRKLNRKHAIAVIGGKTTVLHFHDDGAVNYGTATDLHTFYENDRRPKDGTTVPVSKVWIQHSQRRTYPNGIVFLPNHDVEGAYNHWQGFSVEPDPSKSCVLFLKHLLEVFCSGNQEHFTYMVGWLAHMIQKPEDKPGVAVVAKGKKGAGKDTVFEYVGRLFDRHYVTVANKDQLVGKFNAHQERCLLLHVQEGFWAGDKRDEGSLKYLITSPDVMIEPKGINAFRVKSVLRLFVSSNERWVVPATGDERRFFVLNVSERRRNDHVYFQALRKEMDKGGPSALLDYLQNYDISKFQVRAVPDTEALAEQKVEGLKNIEAWWHGVLQLGEMEGQASSPAPNVGQSWTDGVIRVFKGDLRASYSSWMRTRRFDGEVVGEVEFTKRLKAMVPALTITRARAGAGGERHGFFVFPDLEACRQTFEVQLGSPLVWANFEDSSPDEEDDDLAA